MSTAFDARPARVLIVDDDATICEALRFELERHRYSVTLAQSGEMALSLVDELDFDVIITDINLGELSGVQLCRQLSTLRPHIPVLIITAFGSMRTAIDAIRAGAFDFVTKPFEIDEILVSLARALEKRRQHEAVGRVDDEVTPKRPWSHDFVGESVALLAIFRLIDRIADLDSSVLITGESGTGKELIARSLHARGRRGGGPFIAINCGAMTETLLESELFGHVKGAFTDARTSREGLLVQASKGTLFLDEIGEMPVGMQVKLLRALQERVVRPVGGNIEVPFDARLVTATHRNLEHLVEQGQFRHDLFYRINVVTIDVPPLRDRADDVLRLAEHFLHRYAVASGKAVLGFTPAAKSRLLNYPWPGNVRELQNCVERAVALTVFDEISVDDLPPKIQEARGARVNSGSFEPVMQRPIDEIERSHILKVLNSVGGNKTQAASILGLDRRTLYRKLAHYEAMSQSASHKPA